MYYRYFKVENGPLIDELSKIKQTNDKHHDQMCELATELGCSQWVMFGVSFGGFIFDEEPDMNVWKRLPKQWKTYSPRKNTPAGKTLWEKINSVAQKIDANSALESINAPRHWFCIDGNRMTRAGLCAGFIGESPVFVQVPWRDADPEEISEYMDKKSRGICYNSELDHLSWVPHESMQEVKEWEMLKWKSENGKKSGEDA